MDDEPIELQRENEIHLRTIRSQLSAIIWLLSFMLVAFLVKSCS